MVEDDEIFVGRAAELGLLEAELRRVRTGTPRVLLIEGPAGIGKSALLRRFLAGAPEARTLRASGDEAEAGLAYSVIDQLAAALDAAGGVGDLVGSDHDPLTLGAALVKVLADMSNEPLIVVVEDSHFADVPSIQALTYALRRLTASCVLTVVVTRPEAENLPEGLRRLAEEGGRSLPLAGLDPGELAELGARLGFRDLPQRGLERLARHTGGNPAHFRALLEELDPEALSRSGEDLPAPRSVSRTVLARVASCTPEAHSLVQAVSVLGQRCPLDLACRLAGLVDPTAALDECAGAQLLELHTTAGGRDVAFPDPLVRAAVYHDLSPGRRTDLHRNAAALLEGADALEHRAAAALVADSALATELAHCAGGEAQQGMWSTAAGHLVSAARVATDASTRHRLLFQAAEYLLLAGEVGEAKALYERLAAASDGARRRCVLGHLALLGGDDRQAEHHLTRAWELADPVGDPDVLAVASEQLARLCATQMRPRQAADWAQRAMDASPDPAAKSLALPIRVVALALSGRVDEALALVASLPEGQEELTAWDAVLLVHRGIVRLWLGELPQGRTDLAAAVEARLPGPTASSSLEGRAWLAYADYRLGNWEESSAGADLARTTAGETSHVWLLPHLHAMASLVPAARGDWDQAESDVNAGWQGARAAEYPATVGLAAAAEANLAFCQRDDARVVAALAPLMQLESLGAIEEANVLSWRERLVEALVNLDRLEEAEAALVALEEVTASRQRPLALAGAGRLRGILEATRGRTAAARQAFDSAMAHLEDQPVPFEQALVEDAHGRFLRRAGERRPAAGHLQTAAETFARLGASPFLQRTEQELAACGVSVRPQQDKRTADLTPQELAVAQLVAAGHSNKEVARQLAVSVKTVEFHLSNIYAKLGCILAAN